MVNGAEIKEKLLGIVSTKASQTTNSLKIQNNINILNDEEPAAPLVLNLIKGQYENLFTDSFIFNDEILTNKYLLIYFYPKDDTPGCTTQALDFRNLHKDFMALNVNIIGISRDSLKSHKTFAKKYELPFNLLSDVNEELCNQFQVIKQKNMYGKIVRGIQRSTFLYSPQGKLIKDWRNVKANDHATQMLEFLRQHSSS